MQRTQIYFEQDTLKELKEVAKTLNISVSEFIRGVIKKELQKQKKQNLHSFLQEMTPVESFVNKDATKYVQSLRSKSRIIHE